MVVHMRWLNSYNSCIAFKLFLGDDSTFGCTKKPNYDSLRSIIARKYNMQSKCEWLTNHSTFCQLIIC